MRELRQELLVFIERSFVGKGVANPFILKRSFEGTTTPGAAPFYKRSFVGKGVANPFRLKRSFEGRRHELLRFYRAELCRERRSQSLHIKAEL